MEMDGLDIHQVRDKLNQALGRLRRRPDLTEANKRLIERFVDHRASEGVTPERLKIYVDKLMTLGRVLRKDFPEASEEDLRALVRRLETEKYHYRIAYPQGGEWIREGFYTPQTRQTLCSVLKRFYKWLGGGRDYPEKVRFISTGIRGSNRRLPEDLLTAEEVRKLIQTADHPRDKALIATIYESGGRVKEVGGARIKSVTFDKYGAKITVTGKTGPRVVRLLAAADYLRNWLAGHPLRNQPDAPLWVGTQNGARNHLLHYQAIRYRLRELAQKAGITKRVNPHSFRHARATFLADKLTEAQLKEFMGWEQSSKMAATYVHLSGRNTDVALLRLAGIEVEEANPDVLRCSRCLKENTVTARYCHACGQPLDIQAAVQAEEKERKFEDKLKDLMETLENEEVRAFIAKKKAEQIKQAVPAA